MVEPSNKPAKMTTHDNSFDWHDGVNIKEYFEKQLEDLRRYYDSKLQSIEDNTVRAAELMEKRLDGMNEFREALKDTQSRSVSTPECKALMSTVQSDVQLLRESKAMLEGKASQNSVILAIVLSVIGIAVAIAGYFVRLN